MATSVKAVRVRRPGDLTVALDQWSKGQQEALDPFLPTILRELQAIARHHLQRGGRSLTLDTSALINEAFVKLLGVETATWETRSRFYAYMGAVMRNLVLDGLRRRQASSRNSGGSTLPLKSCEELPETAPTQPDLGVDIERAFGRLRERSVRQAEGAQLRIFMRLSSEEIAKALGVSRATVTRDWTAAYRFLARELHDSEEIS